MKITICGSVTFMTEMENHKKELEQLGFEEAFIPEGFGSTELSAREIKDRLTLQEDSQRKIDHDLIRRHFNLIIKSDCILVANYEKKGIENYIGGNTFLEMGYAFVLGKPIFVLNPLPDTSYITELNGMQPIIINGNLAKIKEYYRIGLA